MKSFVLLLLAVVLTTSCVYAHQNQVIWLLLFFACGFFKKIVFVVLYCWTLNVFVKIVCTGRTSWWTCMHCL